MSLTRNPIVALDADPSNFFSMMDKVSGIERIVSSQPKRVGQIVQQIDGSFRRVTSCKRRDPDNWFAPELYDIVLQKPWAAAKPYDYKFEWIEDELMPRFAARITNIS